MPQYYVCKSILVQFNAARVRQAVQKPGNILPRHTSNSSMDWKAACKGKGWGQANPFPWSSSWGETAHRISNCWVRSSTEGATQLCSCDCRQGEGTRTWAPNAHFHEQTDVVPRFSLHKIVAQNQSKGSDSLNPTGQGPNSCTKLRSRAWGQAKSRRGFTASHGSTGRTIFQSLLPLGHTECHFSAPTSTLRRGEVGNNSLHFCRENWPLPRASAASGGSSWHRSGTGGKEPAALCFPPRWLGDLRLPPCLCSYQIPKPTRLEELESTRTCWCHVRRDACK